MSVFTMYKGFMIPDNESGRSGNFINWASEGLIINGHYGLGIGFYQYEEYKCINSLYINFKTLGLIDKYEYTL